MRRTLVTLVALTIAAGTLEAQDPEAGFAAGAALGVKPGKSVRVAVPGEGRVTGAVRTSDANGLVLQTAGGPRTFATLPDTLWTRERAIGAGAIVGGIAGIGGGIFLGLIANALCEYDCGSPAADAAVGALVTGVAGAALGTLVGAAIPRWQRRVP